MSPRWGIFSRNAHRLYPTPVFPPSCRDKLPGRFPSIRRSPEVWRWNDKKKPCRRDGEFFHETHIDFIPPRFFRRRVGISFPDDFHQSGDRRRFGAGMIKKSHVAAMGNFFTKRTSTLSHPGFSAVVSG